MEYAILGIACLLGILAIVQSEKISTLKLRIQPMEKEIDRLIRIAASKTIKITYENRGKNKRQQDINFAATSVSLAITEFRNTLKSFDQKVISGQIKFSNGLKSPNELFFQTRLDGPVESICSALEGITRWSGMCFVTGYVFLDVNEETPKPKVLIKVVEVLENGSYKQDLDDIVAKEIEEVTKNFKVVEKET